MGGMGGMPGMEALAGMGGMGGMGGMPGMPGMGDFSMGDESDDEGNFTLAFSVPHSIYCRRPVVHNCFY